MRPARRWAILHDVSHETIDVTLELRLSVDSLTGRAVAPDGTVREFAGWLGLVAAVDALAPGERVARPPEPTERRTECPPH